MLSYAVIYGIIPVKGVVTMSDPITAVEYGRGNARRIMLLHGGGLSWWNYREVALLLQGDYHVILPILDGHGGSGRPFCSIEENAAALLRYIDEYCQGRVFLLGGLSLGGQIAAEMLAMRPGVCECAILESACVIPSKWERALIRPMLNMSYGLIRQKWFARLQFRSLKIKEALFQDYYADTCRITCQDMTAFLQDSTGYCCKDGIRDTDAGVHIVVGEKETAIMRASAEKLHRMIPGSTLQIKKGLFHGEFSINHPAEYAELIRKLPT